MSENKANDRKKLSLSGSGKLTLKKKCEYQATRQYYYKF